MASAWFQRHDDQAIGVATTMSPGFNRDASIRSHVDLARPFFVGPAVRHAARDTGKLPGAARRVADRAPDHHAPTPRCSRARYISSPMMADR